MTPQISRFGSIEHHATRATVSVHVTGSPPEDIVGEVHITDHWVFVTTDQNVDRVFNRQFVKDILLG